MTKSSYYTIEELEKIEENFINNQEAIFTSRWREPSLNIVIELIRQLKSHQDLKYCFKWGDKNGEQNNKS